MGLFGSIFDAVLHPIKTISSLFGKDSAVKNIAPVVGPIGASLIGASSAKATNEAQANLARESFGRQKGETDTAHQREIADLRAAGLNPILSAKYGGSSSAGQSVPVIRNPYESLQGGVSSATALKLQSELTKAQIDTQRSQYALNSANAVKSARESDVVAQKVQQEQVRTEVMQKEKQSKTNWFRRNVTAPLGQAFRDFNPFGSLFSSNLK